MDNQTDRVVGKLVAGGRRGRRLLHDRGIVGLLHDFLTVAVRKLIMSDPVEDYFDKLSDASSDEVSHEAAVNTSKKRKPAKRVKIAQAAPKAAAATVLLPVLPLAPSLPVTLLPDDWNGYRIDAKDEEVSVALVKNNEVVFSVTTPQFAAAVQFAQAFNNIKYPPENKKRKT